MDADSFPKVPEGLLKGLEDRFPERSPYPQETYTDLMWRGGQQSVIRLLRHWYNKQNELQEEEEPNVRF